MLFWTVISSQKTLPSPLPNILGLTLVLEQGPVPDFTPVWPFIYEGPEIVKNAILTTILDLLGWYTPQTPHKECNPFWTAFPQNRRFDEKSRKTSETSIFPTFSDTAKPETYLQKCHFPDHLTYLDHWYQNRSFCHLEPKSCHFGLFSVSKSWLLPMSGPGLNTELGWPESQLTCTGKKDATAERSKRCTSRMPDGTIQAWCPVEVDHKQRNGHKIVQKWWNRMTATMLVQSA